MRDSVNISAAPCLSTIEESYLVRFKPETTASQRRDHVALIEQKCKDKDQSRLGVQVQPEQLENVYPAYMGMFTSDIVKGIQGCPEVMSIRQNFLLEPAAVDWSRAKATLPPDEYQKILGTKGPKGPWEENLSALGSRGKGAHIYIVDCEGFDDADFKKNPSRVFKTKTTTEHVPNSHGTMVANVAAGDTVGLASEAFVYLYCNGFAMNEVVVAFEDIIKNHKELNKKSLAWQHGLINLSFNVKKPGYNITKEIFDAIVSAQNANLIVSMAAGNESSNWDEQLLGYHKNRPFLNLVGSIDRNGFPALHTNFGIAVNIFAPGKDVRVYPEKSNLATQFASGTSLACPMVTGYFACALMDNLGQSGQEEVAGAFTRLQSLTLVQDLYCPWRPGKAPAAATEMRVIGPRPVWHDLVIWPLSEMVPFSETVEGKEQLGGWKALGKQDDWSVRGRAATVGKSHINKTAFVKTIDLWNFGDNLEKEKTQEVKDFILKTLGFDEFWAFSKSYSYNVKIGSQSMLLGTGIVCTGNSSKALGAFIKKSLPIARGEKVTGQQPK